MLVWLVIVAVVAYLTLRLIAGRRRALHRRMLAAFVAEAPAAVRAQRARMGDAILNER